MANREPFPRSRLAGADSLIRSRRSDDDAADEAVFTWFCPPGEPDSRFRFLVVREDDRDLSILPGTDARFKTGLKAWRFDEREGGEHSVYLVTKTRHNRIDLRRVD